MRVGSPRLESADGRTRIVADVSFADGSAQAIWFSVDERFAPHLDTTSSDAFLVALLPEAMHRGEDIVLEGAVSRELRFHAGRYVQEAVLLLRHPFRRVAISQGGLLEGERRGTGVAAAFSGGVDSFATLMDHSVDPAPESDRLTHLLFNGVGALEEGEIEDRLASLRAIAAEVGCDVIDVRTNLAAVLQVGFPVSHSFRNAACAMLLPGLLRRYLYSAGYRVAAIGRPATTAGALDPMLLSLISTPALTCTAVGGEHDRTDKIRRIVDLPAAQRHLNVCVSPRTFPNCSRCWKCGRTLFVLERLGKLEAFSEAFDLAVWRAHRARFIGAEILNFNRRRNVHTAELRRLASATGHRFTSRERLLGLAASVLPQPLYDRLGALLDSG
jgi:hypothetical protein